MAVEALQAAIVGRREGRGRYGGTTWPQTSAGLTEQEETAFIVALKPQWKSEALKGQCATSSVGRRLPSLEPFHSLSGDYLKKTPQLLFPRVKLSGQIRRFFGLLFC